MNILNYDIKKVNNGLIWSAFFVCTGVPLINLIDDTFFYKEKFVRHENIIKMDYKIKLNTTIFTILTISGFLLGYNKKQHLLRY